MEHARRDRRAQGGRAAGAPRARPARRLQGQPDPLEDRQEGLSAGRVQTVALRLIVEREREIRAFKPVEYWTIEALLEKDGQRSRPRSPRSTATSRSSTRPRTRRPWSDAVRQHAVRRHRGREARTPEESGAPFTTSTLQQEAAKKLGFGSKRTMRVAQDLYEGMRHGRGRRGRSHHLHAHRLDARVGRGHRRGARLHRRELRQAVSAGRAEHLQREEERPRRTRTRRSARPTPPPARARPGATSSPTSSSSTSSSGSASWRRRWRRRSSTRRPWTSTSGRYLFRATGTVLVFHGFLALYREGREKEEGKTLDDQPLIPPLAQGERGRGPGDHAVAALHRAAAAVLRGEPGEGARAARHRPAVDLRAIISTLSAREYVQLEQRRFFPTELGEMVEKVMVEQVPRHLQRRVHLRHGAGARPDRGRRARVAGRAQGLLHAVQQGARGGGPERARGRRARPQPEDLAKERCPKCGSAIELKTGRFGPYWPASSTRTPATT